jgi:hypothetical protein
MTVSISGCLFAAAFIVGTALIYWPRVTAWLHRPRDANGRRIEPGWTKTETPDGHAVYGTPPLHSEVEATPEVKP